MRCFLLNRRTEVSGEIVYYLPLKPEHREAMLGRFLQVTRATLKGSVVIGLFRGTGDWIVFCGIEGAVFWSAIMMVLSVIPGLEHHWCGDRQWCGC
ncbi:hypothetical protein [Rubritalea tangerina]|uniref:hypothetical protein n=1 Tax=Rubritalea tangerina TaxID=430798 RepID=UPI00361A29AC